MAVIGLGPFLTVPCDGMWSVIVAFPGHTHLLFYLYVGGVNI